MIQRDKYFISIINRFLLLYICYYLLLFVTLYVLQVDFLALGPVVIDVAGGGEANGSL